MSIRDNYLTVMENIAAACAQCGRGEGEVKLITVTKFVDTGRIAEAVAAARAMWAKTGRRSSGTSWIFSKKTALMRI